MFKKNKKQTGSTWTTHIPQTCICLRDIGLGVYGATYGKWAVSHGSMVGAERGHGRFSLSV